MICAIAPLKLPCLTLLSLIVAFQSRAIAQVIPDGTLGPESSQLIDVSAMEQLIQGGALRDENLFHSFEQFSIGEGGQVTFDNPAAVQRVFSRVTGGLPSEILGTLGSTGTADVYFLNPNGIVFGPDARLDVGGSFIASTGDAFEFAGLGTYSARSPEVPSPLLTILPSALRFGQPLPGDIVVQSTSDDGGLQVPNGESLVLLGGEVTVDGGQLNLNELNGGQLKAPGGRVEIGSAVGEGSVGLAPDGRLTFAEGLARGGITFNGAFVDASFAGGGDIGVTARTIELIDSYLLTSIDEGLGSPDSQAGNIVLEATESIELTSAFIGNGVQPNANGRGGDINITTPVLVVQGGAQIFSRTDGEGDSGDINIAASNRVTLAGRSEDRSRPSALINTTNSGSSGGNSGNISITTPVLEVLNGAEVGTSTNGQGDAGDVIVSASNRVTVAGMEDGEDADIYSLVSSNGVGSGGNLTITTPVLEVRDFAEINTDIFGRGDAGDIVVNASDRVTIATVGSISSDVWSNAIGAGGNIEITTPVLEVLDRAALFSRVFGQGNGGDILINARESVSLGFSVSVASSVARSEAVGDGGDIEITTRVLDIRDGALLVSDTVGNGDAGDIVIDAEQAVRLVGSKVFTSSAGEEIESPSVISSGLSGGTSGNGGDISISTGTLEILDGALLNSGTLSDGAINGILFEGGGESGSSGDIIINASELVRIAGKGEFPQVPGIEASVPVSSVTSSTAPESTGDSGDISITTPRLEISEGLLISATQGAGNAGDIVAEAQVLEVLAGGQIVSDTRGAGDAGDIVLNASESVRFAGQTADRLPRPDGSTDFAPSGAFSTTAREFTFNDGSEVITIPASTGNGGTITITAPLLEVIEGAQLAADTEGAGDAGDIILNASNRVTLNDGQVIADSESVAGRGGDILVTAPLLTLANQSEITTDTFSTDGGNILLNLANLLALADNSLISTEAGTAEAGGDGGDITINTQFIATQLSENSDIVADAFDGNGGNVDITATGGIFGIVARPERTPQSDITASSRNGVSGTIVVESPDVDPNQDAVELPVNPDTSEVAQSCREAYVQSGSEFVVTGRGGLPQGPLDSSVTTLWQDALPIESDAQAVPEVTAPEAEGGPATDSDATTASPIVEIQGWIKDEHGQIVLVAEDPLSVVVGQPVTCQG